MEIQKIKAMVSRHMDLILKAEKDLWAIPEVGYKEFKTDAYLKAAFRDLGYELTEADGIPGFYTVLDTGKAGPTILVLAELDALYCADHPGRDPKTNAVHACGHYAQCATILGIAAVLKEEGALEGLSGKIKLCLVPAEEGIEIEYRMDLIKQGKISFASGKQEFLARGYFDDVDLAFMVHAGMSEGTPENKLYRKYQGYNGVIRKKIMIKGKAAHAGDCPHLGVNALNAATLAISAVNNLRETFKESDFVRFHPIITKGGDVVNAVPAEVVMQSYVRAATTEALDSANKRINRAISAAAAANGCSVVISDIAGSEPFHEDERLTDLYKEVCEEIGGKDCYEDFGDVWEACSTDMGDLSVNFPAIHPYAIGAVGTEHGKDYNIPDPKKLCGNSAVLQLGLLYRLLENGAKKANEIKANYQPVFSTIADYVAFKKAQTAERETVLQNTDGSLTIL
ncbi:MAG: amidohydrolase [Clostridia bacterium]|nr:amidohydrolase [Clostridia bacterium]